MGNKLSLCLFLLILLPAFGHAQYVYGDRSTNKYYGIDCREISQIEKANLQGFKTSAAAEKAGFSKGDKCTTVMSAPAPIGEPTPLPKSGSTVTVRDLMKGSVGIALLQTDIKKYKRSVEKFVGTISLSSSFWGKYEYKADEMWAFELCDVSGCGFFYMYKTDQSDHIRDVIMNPTRDRKLIWICQYQAEELTEYNHLLGEILSCSYRYLAED